MHNPLAPLMAKLYEGINNNPRNSNLRYVGLTIYRESKEKKRTYYTVHRSASLYINQDQTFKISYDDFGGYVFPFVHGNDKGQEASGKNFNHLQLFFPGIDVGDEAFDQFFLFPDPDKSKKKWRLQLILLYRNKPLKGFNRPIVGEIKSYLKDNSLKCDISLPSTRIIEKPSLIIIDLIRNPHRHDTPSVKYADASITHKLIFDIAAIVSSYGFRVCGNTGDGFFFLLEHQDRKSILRQQAITLLTELERYLARVTAYLKPLNQCLLHHRLRVLIDEVETVFEMDDGNRMMSKLYFSTDLDAKFATMASHPKHNGRHLLITGSLYDKIEWSSPIFERKNHGC